METPNKNPNTENDYLWDGSGTPDPQIQQLETLLGKFRHDGAVLEFPKVTPVSRWKSPRVRMFAAFAAAAVILIAAAIFFRKQPEITTASAGWDISNFSGTPRIGTKLIAQKNASLKPGQVLETDARSSASLESSDTGQIEIEPGTRLRILTMTSGRRHIALERGTIHAFIWAPAGEFVVDTPSATTVDLGCSYTLHVDDSGAGIVRTSLGWVGFKLNGRESFIPAGAACATKPKSGPGTPYFEDAPSELRAALSRFDFEDTTPEQRANDLATILANSRAQDALTLWHLLSRVDAGQRTRVFDRLNATAPAPAGVTREGILALDQPMLDQWWNSLGFDNISVWRHWEHTWPAPDSNQKMDH